MERYLENEARFFIGNKMINYPTKKLGEIVPFLRGSGLSKKDLNPSGKYKCILYGQLYTMYGPVIDEVVSRTDTSGNVLSVAGDVLVPGTTTADEVGIAVASALNESGVILGGDINIIRTKNKLLDSKFLAYSLNGPLKMRMVKYARGTNIIHLSGRDIAKIEVSIPPKNIQNQIVERLDKIAEAQKLNDELIQKTDELFQSLLHKELNPAGKDWKMKKLSEVGEIVTGTTPSTKNGEYWNGEFLWATPTDIKENTFILTDTPKKLSREGYEKTRPVPQNAILVTCIASIGKMAIAGKGMATNQQINSIICNKENDPFFIFFSLQKDKKKLINLGKTTAVPIINKSEFGRIKIPLPPLETQKQIVTKLYAVQNYKTQLLTQKSKLKELFDSALSKSFNG